MNRAASLEAYQERNAGYSPDEIRTAAFEIIRPYLRGTLLDAGSGAGGWIQIIRELPERIIAVDLLDCGAGKIEGVEFHALDLSAAALPAPDDSVDVVTALEIIEHLANQRCFVGEAHRILKPGGKFLITTPSCESLTAKLSYLFRGYFPSFSEEVYRFAGHIAPTTELDLRRMAAEYGFSKIEFHFPLPGRIPKLALKWQSLFPFLKGKLWSDVLIAVLTK